MIELIVPGWRELRLTALVLDVNGTLALDGEVVPDVDGRLRALRAKLDVHLLSADTYGRLEATAASLGIAATRLEAGGDEADQKSRFVQQLGADPVAAVGNGMNDVGMLKVAALGIAVLGHEGLALQALLGADVVAVSITEALDLLLYPRRLVASLRR